jgi:hypothetical protein
MYGLNHNPNSPKIKDDSFCDAAKPILEAKFSLDLQLRDEEEGFGKKRSTRSEQQRDGRSR